MRKIFKRRSLALLILAGLVLAACGGSATEAPAVTEAPATEAAPAGPSYTIIGAVNRDVTQAAQSPFLTLDAQKNMLVVWAENSSGGVRQIFASQLNGTTFQPLGTSINVHTNVLADSPTITVAGENNAVPWVAWSEPSPGFGDVAQVFASRFSVDTGLWQQAGQDRGGGEASLNVNTNRAATNPFIFSGSAELGTPPVPWVAWEEVSNVNPSSVQVFVAKGVKDETSIGGFKWETVGQVREDGEQTLNVNRFRLTQHITGVFAETANSVPWVTWHEVGRDLPERIFTARGVADPNSPGGFKWINVPTCDPNDETSCALNINPLNDAKDASMAAGSVVAGESTVPWITWCEVGQNGKCQIFVARLDTSTRNSFLQVGGSLNVDPNHVAKTPVIVFLGNVPYVTWLEDDGTGKFVLQMRHLASDPQTGTWALDTPANGFNLDPSLSDFDFSVVASADTLFLAWGEGDPASSASQMVIGAFRP
ncbi:MAG: hypothetical protein HYU84_15240 [Chloroflexi bacterium]|nr:hypothetical protein [Chloroflexota bacterium]MBI3168808.1 hypothetical protein [Chloroflexota bacterium]